jgi:hypothetical protein
LADAPGIRLASVRQGRSLLIEAQALGIPVNRHFDQLAMLPETGARPVTLRGGLTVTVVGPGRAQLEALSEEWQRELERMRLTTSPEPAARIPGNRREPIPRTVFAAYDDTSVHNLSSIVLLLEKGGKRILLTSDGRGDLILKGLEQAGLLSADGTLHVDVLQLPHQGSARSVEIDFFRRITADRYVVNGNGRFGNPDDATLEMLAEARGDAAYALYFTHPDGEDEMRSRLETFFGNERGRIGRYDVFFRARESSSMRVNLLSPVSY